MSSFAGVLANGVNIHSCILGRCLSTQGWVLKLTLIKRKRGSCEPPKKNPPTNYKLLLLLDKFVVIRFKRFTVDEVKECKCPKVIKIVPVVL